jgi:RHS repeat-associated protein
LNEDGPWADDTVTYSYDGWTRVGMTLQQPNASAWSQTYDYDQFHRLNSTTSPAGTFGYDYEGNGSPYANFAPDLIRELDLGSPYEASKRSYDHLARLTNTTLYAWGATADSHAYAYNAGSQRTQQVFKDGNYMDYGYDNIGQLITAQGAELGGTTNRLHEQFGYAYDAAGNLNRRTNNALIQTFNVNNRNELTTASRSGTLTVAGLILGTPASLSVSGTGLSPGSATFYGDGSWARPGATLANGNNSYTASATDTVPRTSSDTVGTYLPASPSYSYDTNGNMLSDGTRFLSYDDENELISVTVSNAWRSEFVYDGMMRRRVRKEFTWSAGSWFKTNEIRYVYDGLLVVQERDANNLPQVSYTRGLDLSGSLQSAGGIGGLLARTDHHLSSIGDVSAHAYYHADGNGNVTALVNNNGYIVARYQYDPYGNVLAISGSLAHANLYRFGSKESQVNAGLYYYGYRFYEPSLQRWINADPLGIRTPVKPWPNLALFCSNNPFFYTDPYGECNWGQFARGIYGLAAGTAGIVVGVATAEVGIGIPIAVSGTVGVSYGLGNIVASFAPQDASTQAMQNYPHNVGGLAGKVAGGEKGQSVGEEIEAAFNMVVGDQMNPNSELDPAAPLNLIEAGEAGYNLGNENCDE